MGGLLPRAVWWPFSGRQCVGRGGYDRPGDTFAAHVAGEPWAEQACGAAGQSGVQMGAPGWTLTSPAVCPPTRAPPLWASPLPCALLTCKAVSKLVTASGQEFNKIFNAAKRYKNTVGMAEQYKVVSPNLFLLHLSTFHTRVRKLNNVLN